jgi:DNA replication licensing factor MCM6
MWYLSNGDTFRAGLRPCIRGDSVVHNRAFGTNESVLIREVSIVLYLLLGEIGQRRSQLVDWYLGEMEGEVDDEQELLEMKMLIDMVIDRLIRHDRVLLEVRDEEEEGGGDKMEEEDDPYLVVHPNYVIET